MDPEQVQSFWSEVGSTKTFTDPFFIEQFTANVPIDGLVVEYGCGYGRILNLLWENGFHRLLGFDFAPKMLERGRATHPHLRLQQIEKSGRIPLADQSVNAIILSTVLCCNPHLEEQSKITAEIERLLTKGGILYLYDFLITRTEKNLHRYSQHAQPGDENYGVYQTIEGIFVRHHSLWWILDLLQQFNILWLEQTNHTTVNNNPVRTVHLIAQKP